MPLINIAGKDKAVILAALYNHSQPVGLGFLNYRPEDMTVEEAQAFLDKSYKMSFDYLYGRIIKVKLSEDSFDPWLYDRDNGEGAAERALVDILK